MERDEMEKYVDNAMSTVGIQLGAVEKILRSEINSAKVWGIAALIGGQTLAGLVAAYVGPRNAAHAAMQAVNFLF